MKATISHTMANPGSCPQCNQSTNVQKDEYIDDEFREIIHSCEECDCRWSETYSIKPCAVKILPVLTPTHWSTPYRFERSIRNEESQK